SGALFTKSPIGIKGCGPLVFAVLNDNAVAMNLPDFPSTDGITDRFYRYTLSGSDTLVLEDAFGTSTTFQRTTMIPDEATCAAATIGNAIAIPGVQPGRASGLASDGTLLWYTRITGGLSGIDVGTRTISGSVDLGSLDRNQTQWIEGIQNTDFWLTCGCGG